MTKIIIHKTVEDTVSDFRKWSRFPSGDPMTSVTVTCRFHGCVQVMLCDMETKDDNTQWTKCPICGDPIGMYMVIPDMGQRVGKMFWQTVIYSS